MNKKTEPGPNFEETLAELEKLIASLEEGDLSLEDSLSGFKHGIELTRQCQLALDDAQQTVELLTDTQNEDSLKPFEPNA